MVHQWNFQNAGILVLAQAFVLSSVSCSVVLVIIGIMLLVLFVLLCSVFIPRRGFKWIEDAVAMVLR